ncbi:MAG: response regulator transcription factor [Calditrichae bacterium]|nr:response regulator transcription factor [Calditrichia bacterium]
MQKITIGIVEDNNDIRSVVSTFIENQPEFELFVSAPSAEHFLEYFKTGNTPDILIMDIGLPGMSGISAMPLILDKAPETNIIMFTVYDNPEKIFAALCAGATGYLVKSTPLDQLKTAILDLHKGGSPMSPEIARRVIEHFQPQKKEKKISQLSDREKEIVVGLVDGLSYKLVADRLDISIDTVRQHIRNIYRKLHVNSKAEVITMSLRGEI